MRFTSFPGHGKPQAGADVPAHLGAVGGRPGHDAQGESIFPAAAQPPHALILGGEPRSFGFPSVQKVLKAEGEETFAPAVVVGGRTFKTIAALRGPHSDFPLGAYRHHIANGAASIDPMPKKQNLEFPRGRIEHQQPPPRLGYGISGEFLRSAGVSGKNLSDQALMRSIVSARSDEGFGEAHHPGRSRRIAAKRKRPFSDDDHDDGFAGEGVGENDGDDGNVDGDSDAEYFGELDKAEPQRSSRITSVPKSGKYEENFSGKRHRGQLKTSNFRGVSRCGRDGRWQARIRIGGIVKYLGRFQTQEIAARCYDMASLLIHGQRAPLNFADSRALMKSGKFEFIDVVAEKVREAKGSSSSNGFHGDDLLSSSSQSETSSIASDSASHHRFPSDFREAQDIASADPDATFFPNESPDARKRAKFEPWRRAGSEDRFENARDGVGDASAEMVTPILRSVNAVDLDAARDLLLLSANSGYLTVA